MYIQTSKIAYKPICRNSPNVFPEVDPCCIFGKIWKFIIFRVLKNLENFAVFQKTAKFGKIFTCVQICGRVVAGADQRVRISQRETVEKHLLRMTGKIQFNFVFDKIYGVLLVGKRI